MIEYRCGCLPGIEVCLFTTIVNFGNERSSVNDHASIYRKCVALQDEQALSGGPIDHRFTRTNG